MNNFFLNSTSAPSEDLIDNINIIEEELRNIFIDLSESLPNEQSSRHEAASEINKNNVPARN